MRRVWHVHVHCRRGSRGSHGMDEGGAIMRRLYDSKVCVRSVVRAVCGACETQTGIGVPRVNEEVDGRKRVNQNVMVGRERT